MDSLYKKVTTTEVIPAYYSNYAGLPEQNFEPGMIGIVMAVPWPKDEHPHTFCCVDFTGTNHSRPQWRCALTKKQIVYLPDDAVATGHEEGERLDFKTMLGHFFHIWKNENGWDEVKVWYDTLPKVSNIAVINMEALRSAPERVIWL